MSQLTKIQWNYYFSIEITKIQTKILWTIENLGKIIDNDKEKEESLGKHKKKEWPQVFNFRKEKGGIYKEANLGEEIGKNEFLQLILMI